MKWILIAFVLDGTAIDTGRSEAAIMDFPTEAKCQNMADAYKRMVRPDITLVCLKQAELRYAP